MTSTLKVRDKASTESEILAKLAPGATFKIIEEVEGSFYPPNNSTTWYKVKLAEQEGFVAADFIDVITPPLPPPEVFSSVGRVNHRVTSRLRVRQEPSVSAPVVTNLELGAVFKVLEELHGEAYDFGRTDWHKIEYEGKQGYVAAYYVDIQSEPKPLNRWDLALPHVPTDGASAVTAGQDNLPEGVQSSRDMAQTDLGRIKAIANRFVTAASKFSVPAAVLAAIASRESRCGAILDNGWGDHGNAFGIMQVDKRYHDLEDTTDPANLDHIEQATGIFARNLEEVQRRHPDWEDPYILKGAAVAYNSGVNNVRTKDGMDVGTTGNDYGSDVMARAQYYANHSELSIFRI
ncbi:MAG: SH3 domain-containing protein [Syntrophobacterales bacterium]